MAQHPNIQRIRDGYAAFSAGDFDGVSKFIAEDVVWHVNESAGPLAGDYKGLGEVLGFFGKLVEEFGSVPDLQIHDVLANDEHGIVLLDFTSKRKGKTLTSKAVHVSHLNAQGQATEFWSFDDATPEASKDFWS